LKHLRLFQCVIWYGNRSSNANDNTNFDLAQQTLPYFIVSGGKLLFSTGFPDFITSQGNIINFAPVDSLTNFQFTTVLTGTQTIVVDPTYPLMEVSTTLDRTRGIKYWLYPLIYNCLICPYDST
jgi:hypothetical protein